MQFKKFNQKDFLSIRSILQNAKEKKMTVCDVIWFRTSKPSVFKWRGVRQEGGNFYSDIVYGGSKQEKKKIWLGIFFLDKKYNFLERAWKFFSLNMRRWDESQGTRKNDLSEKKFNFLSINFEGFLPRLGPWHKDLLLVGAS